MSLPTSRRTGSKQESRTASGVSSMIRLTPVTDSKARMLRPSRPMILPFISSPGRCSTDTTDSLVCSLATRWMARVTIRRARGLPVAPGLVLGLPDDERGLALGLVLDARHQFRLRLVGGEPGGPLQHLPALVLEPGQLGPLGVQLLPGLVQGGGPLFQLPQLRRPAGAPARPAGPPGAAGRPAAGRPRPWRPGDRPRPRRAAFAIFSAASSARRTIPAASDSAAALTCSAARLASSSRCRASAARAASPGGCCAPGATSGAAVRAGSPSASAGVTAAGRGAADRRMTMTSKPAAASTATSPITAATMPIALLIAHPNPARWPGYRHPVPGLPAARGHARRPWRLSSVASRSHPAAARSFLAASSRTLLKNRPIRPGGPYPWPTCLPPACPVPGRLPSGPGRAQAPWPSSRARPPAGPFRLFTSAFADQHLAAVRLSLDNDLGKHASARRAFRGQPPVHSSPASASAAMSGPNTLSRSRPASGSNPASAPGGPSCSSASRTTW